MDLLLPVFTLLLAYIAVLTVIYSRIQNNRIRKRDLLIDIDAWARNGHKILSGYLPKKTWRDRDNTLRLLAEVNTRKVIMVNSASLFDNNLSQTIKGAAEDLDIFCNTLDSHIEDMETGDIEYENMEVLQGQCDKSLIRVFELTSLLRTKLKI